MTHPESNDLKTYQGGDTTEFEQGQLVDGRYRVISCIGTGGMGLVYRVNQILLNKEFALKTIDKKNMSEIAIPRFQQEARTAFSLDHPNIIKVNDFGLLDDQTPFLVMELLNGETLGARLKRKGRLTLEEAIPIFVQLCFGLAYAHQCGIVHRDIKPNNIMLLEGLPPGAEGSIKILDFGIAKFVQREGGEIQGLTRTGEIFGSPLYMSPEQCGGFRVDHRADIYSLGCVFFEALTGAPPLVGENAMVTMMRHQTDQPLTLKQASLGSDFPQAIEDIVATMLAKSPDNRYQNLGIAAHDLGAFSRGDSPSQTARSARTPLPHEAKTISMSSTRFYALLAGIALLSATLAGVSVYMFHLFQGEALVQPKAESNQKESAAKPSTASGQPSDDLYKLITPEELKNELLQPTPDKRLTLQTTKLPAELLTIIANTSWIQSLDLHACQISNENLGLLAPLHLSMIDFDESTLNDIGAQGLSVCKGLSDDIRVNHTAVTDDGVGKLLTVQGLKNLALAGTGITEKSLIELAKTKTLCSVDLREIKAITNQGLKALERSRVGILDLGSTQIDDGAIMHLSKMDKLWRVGLDKTKVTIKGLEQLCRSSKIKVITLEHCPRISKKEIEKLKIEFPSIAFTTQDVDDH